jgi:hypothetical protein
VVTYATAHRMVASVKGPARTHPCAICGRRAHQWAYVGQRVGGERMPYSTEPGDYDPMCRRCHQAYDRTLIRVLDRHPGDVTLW